MISVSINCWSVHIWMLKKVHHFYSNACLKRDRKGFNNRVILIFCHLSKVWVRIAFGYMYLADIRIKCCLIELILHERPRFICSFYFFFFMTCLNFFAKLLRGCQQTIKRNWYQAAHPFKRTAQYFYLLKEVIFIAV